MTTEENPSLPSPPFYAVANIDNLRDAALSVRTASGAGIRPKILFRSAEVSKLDFEGWKAVRELGVAHVFDLRSKPEVDKGWAGIVGKDADGSGDVRPGWMQAMEQAGVKRTWAPVFEESDYSPERLAERYSQYMDEAVTGFVEAYRDILQNGGPAFAQILKYLASLPPPGKQSDRGQDNVLGALVHCTAGKDRTGIFFGLLFDFLGVQRDEIASEYQLTELGLRHIREHVVARLTQSPGFNKYMLSQAYGTSCSMDDIAESIRNDTETNTPVGISADALDKGRQAALRMISAKRESMLKSLDMLDEQFGGAERYMKDKCHLSDTELNNLRTNLLVHV
ncbi:hypothetical protein ACJQWK_07265 [Exserohilum turcicum]|uniref:Tyrosine specific protein phosphatases domain-containing protein n=1 Tax=Exserohilum turcicum (strain 28A) TaxID=671987 RepID=R0IH34_EXST2|nr:uncharacterized protein SETTUDRAFT_136411 [Exserohilum turcica Et28A]EOA84515.1 hypothetical protein SETTUDRAFT_136411 [Exserohilum turcica Et28A]